MSIWWQADNRRFLREVIRIKKLLQLPWFANTHWTTLGESSLLCVKFDLIVGKRKKSFFLVYHEAFPDCPPSVYPLPAERISNHQYGKGGELCLEIRDDNWLPIYTGADMIESTFRLLSIESPNESGNLTVAPSAHNVTFAESVRNCGLRFYLNLVQFRFLAFELSNLASVDLSIRRSYNKRVIARCISFVPQNNTSFVFEASPALRLEGYKKIAKFITVEANLNEVCKAETYQDLALLIGDRYSFENELERFIIIRTGDRCIKMILYRKSEAKLFHFTTVMDTDFFDRTGKSASSLEKRNVGIIGLGSIGSKVAISLARTGVKNFELVDGDILYAGNLARHDGDWRDLGLHKVDAVKQRMDLIQPNTRVRTWNSNLGTQKSSTDAAQLVKALKECELIIDATADAKVFNRLARLVQHASSTLIWGSVLAGGIGGDIARFRPGVDPSPYYIRDAVNQVYGRDSAEMPVESSERYSGLLGDEPLIGTDHAVSTIASHISALALDSLLAINPSTFTAHAYLIGLQNKGIFDGPFDVRPILADAPISNLPRVFQPNLTDT